MIMGQAGHGEGADAMEAGCDNGTGHVEAGHGEGADAMEAGCDNGMGHVGEGADTMEACCDNGTGHVEDSHGEGAGGTVDGRTQKERRIQSSYDTQGLLNVLSKVQKLANKRSGIQTIDTSHNYANTPVITR